MSVIAATPFPSDIATGTSSNVSDGFSWPPVEGVANLVSDQIWSALSNHQPITEPGIHQPAKLSMSPNDTFYNQIIIDPAELILGNLLSTQTRSVKVWNGFLVQKMLTDFQTYNATGIDVQEPVELPYPMRPLQELTYTFSITLDGPAVIDADFNWTVDGQDYQAHLTGSRLVVFPFGPSWGMSQVTETLAWLSNVMRAFSGKEQRRSLRTKARRAFQYTMIATQQDAAYLDNLLWGWQNRNYAFPVWTDLARLKSDALEGDQSLVMDTTTFSFAAGGLAILYDGLRTYEVVEIDAVTPTSLQLAQPVQSAYEAGQLIMPMVIGHLPTSVSISRLTNNKLSAVVLLAAEPTVTDPYTPDGAIPVAYKGIDVIMSQPNWVRGLNITADYQFDTVDADTGKIVWDTTERHPSTERAYSWTLRNRNEILAFRQLLGRLRGKTKTCWVPSWHEDFVVVQNIGSGDTVITVQDNGFRTLIGLDPSRNNIMVRLRDGRYFFREIIGVAGSDENCALQLNASLGVALVPQNILAVHLLQRSRLGADGIDIVWETDRVATVNTSFVTVPE